MWYLLGAYIPTCHYVCHASFGLQSSAANPPLLRPAGDGAQATGGREAGPYIGQIKAEEIYGNTDDKESPEMSMY